MWCCFLGDFIVDRETIDEDAAEFTIRLYQYIPQLQRFLLVSQSPRLLRDDFPFVFRDVSGDMHIAAIDGTFQNGDQATSRLVSTPVVPGTQGKLTLIYMVTWSGLLKVYSQYDTLFNRQNRSPMN